mmetsp:Transcript_41448/g.72794  ORF Transcript_41448/g.72794 Transcript_41448/m.72794 type:complete len:762 (-) Transcript_41448:77-2362(-)
MPLQAPSSAGAVAGPADVRSFRLILSDSFATQSQRVKTLNTKPTSIEQLAGFLDEYFGFTELCRSHGLDPKNLTSGTGGIHLVGLDGARHFQIHNDDQLVNFFFSVRTKLPSIEVQLGKPAAVHTVMHVVPSTRREAKDRIEQLEDLNFKMAKATQKIERALDELERLRVADKDEFQRLVTATKKEIMNSQEAAVSDLQSQIDKLVKVDSGLRRDIETTKLSLTRVEKVNDKRHEEVTKTLDEMNVRLMAQFEDIDAELQRLKTVDEDLNRVDIRQQQQLQEHSDELLRLEQVKLDKKEWEDYNRVKSLEEQQTAVNLQQKFIELDRELRTTIATNRVDLEKADEDNRNWAQEEFNRVDRELRAEDEKMDAGFTDAKDALAARHAELTTRIDSEVNEINRTMEQRFVATTKDVTTKDFNINRRTDELDARTEATFVALNERLNELVKAERARLGTIEKDLSEGFAKTRSDFRADLERLRSDYEQEASRLDGDLTDLHMKHDVVKQEINFFQSRLMEQRDWAQRQLAETATATRAAQVDAQEGVAATTKMLHALRDDQVTFRDKMAKHVSLLQHASDSYGDAINTLETQRSRMRLELDALLGDHKAYVGDMDGWADDVRVKIERLFRAMEPPRCEWRIGQAAVKLKEMKRPLAVKSPSFALQGLREVQMELYPHGHNNSPEGKAVLRILMPAGALVRYQTWLGRMSDGSREYESGGSLTVDILYDHWKDQVQEDGSLNIIMEVLQDLNNTDDSLARAVHLEG